MQSLIQNTLFKPNIKENPCYEDTIKNRKHAHICQIAKWCFALLGTGLALTHAFSRGDRRVFIAKHLATQLAVMAFSLASFCTALFFQISGSNHKKNLTKEKIANAKFEFLFDKIANTTDQNLIETLNANENLVEEIENDIDGYRQIKLLFSVKQINIDDLFNLIKLAFEKEIIFSLNESIEIDQNFDFSRDLEPFVNLQAKLLEHTQSSSCNYYSSSDNDIYIPAWSKIINNLIPRNIL
ncbi:MAG: hypothetical protein Tsb0021_08060 [Chlamydiales bacterium]